MEVKQQQQQQQQQQGKYADQPCDIGAVINCDGMVSNLEFHRSGRYLALTTNQSAIHLVDALSGTEKKKIFLKKEGVSHIQFSHHEMCLLLSHQSVVSSSTSSDNAHPPSNNFDVKYLCMYDNRYLRYFRGHTASITSLSMHPISDQFLSASLDGSVRIWDINSPQAVAKINLPLPCGPFQPLQQQQQRPMYRPPLVSYDNAGLVFGVLHHNTLKLYDARNFDNGPFENIFPSIDLLRNASIHNSSNNNSSGNGTDQSDQPQQPLTHAQFEKFITNASWVNFEFSPDAGNNVLINTNTDALFLLDGLNPQVEPKIITNRKNESGQHLGATFSADGQFVVTGNEDNELQVFDRHSCNLVHTLTGHVAPVTHVRYNPVYDMMASACVNGVLWLPRSSSASANSSALGSYNEMRE